MDLEVVIAKIDPNESLEMKVFNDQQISLTRSQHFTGIISKVNSCEIQKFSDDDLQSILFHPVNTIDLQQCSIHARDLILRCHLFYVRLPDGPIGIELVPAHQYDGCGGLTVTNILNQNMITIFQKDDVIISVNNIEIKDLKVDQAVQLLQTTSNRLLTIVRSRTAIDRSVRESLRSFLPLQPPQSVFIPRSQTKKYTPNFADLPSYRGYICDIEKRFSSRPSFAFIPSLDLRK
jgi:hypothetical protein